MLLQKQMCHLSEATLKLIKTSYQNNLMGDVFGVGVE